MAHGGNEFDTPALELRPQDLGNKKVNSEDMFILKSFLVFLKFKFNWAFYILSGDSSYTIMHDKL